MGGILVALILLVHVAVIIDVLSNPSLPGYWSYVAIGYVMIAEAVAFCVFALTHLPLKFEDNSLLLE